MAKKTALFGGRTVKVENRSAFDKSHLNMLTTGVGTITPIVKQLVIPSSGRCRIPIHVELPPLATDAYIRSHLKTEAFFVPLRLCYGGFQSWFSGEPVWDADAEEYDRARLPRAFVVSKIKDQSGEDTDQIDPNSARVAFGPGSLTDYFDVRFLSDSSTSTIPDYDGYYQFNGGEYNGIALNVFPYIAYHLIYDHFFRNKSVSRPAFLPFAMGARGVGVENGGVASHLPYMSCTKIIDVLLASEMDFEDLALSGIEKIGDLVSSPYLDNLTTDYLRNGYSLYQLRQRNFGDDYFTAAKPDAQAGNAHYVQTDANGRFTISAIRAQNALQEFEENQNYATPDFIQTNMARYGVKLSEGIAQKPILLGSADFPIYTKSIEQNAQVSTADGDLNSRNPFTSRGYLGAKSGIASGNGTFEFDFDVKEPGYIMVMATLVPEANYASGIAKDMRIFTTLGSLTDLPVGLLEHIGDEPIFASELTAGAASPSTVFGYVQRYLWHKAGEPNQIHGLFRKGQTLQAFAPQREFESSEVISTEFLEVPTTALDDVASVESGVSSYGVMMDCAIELFVSEPLSESALPALVNPASEHGRSIYLSNGGSKLA